MKTVTEMTNTEVVENNINCGQDGYVLITNKYEADRAIQLGEQFNLGEEITRELNNKKLYWM